MPRGRLSTKKPLHRVAVQRMGDWLTNPTAPCPIEVYLHAQSGQTLGDAYYNDVVFQFDHPISPPEGYGLYLSLLSMTLAHTFPVINQYNDSIFVDGIMYQIPQGNHSITTLVKALNAALPVTASFDPISLKLTLSSDTSHTVSGSLLEVLGIPQNAMGTSLSSTNTVDLTGQNTVFVLTDRIGGNIDTRSVNGSSAVLARFGVDAPPLGVIQYTDFSSGRIGIEYDGVLARIRIQLQDENRRPLQASIPWDATLGIAFMRTGRVALQVDRPLALRYEPILS